MKKTRKILVLREKHADRYIHVPAGRLDDVILRIVRQRHEQGWYDGPQLEGDEPQALQEALEGNASSARWFFGLRADGEYEGWGLETLEELL